MDKRIIVIGGALGAAAIAAYYLLRKQTIEPTGNTAIVTAGTQQQTTQTTQGSASSPTPTGGTGAGTGNTGTTTYVSQSNNSNQVIITTSTPSGSNSDIVSSVAVTGGYITVSPTTINRTPNTGQVITIEGYNFFPNEKGYISMGNIQIGGFTANANGTWTATVQNTESAVSTSGLWNAIQDSGSTAYIQAYGYDGTGYTNKVEVTLV
ncbi:MAG: hypothetical protein QXH07_01780 [Thermoplasmata archaeon]